jgi:hypothetical protein
MKLTKYIQDEFFTEKFKDHFYQFLKYDYYSIKKRFRKFKFKSNGSKQACKIIISCLS